MMSKLTSFAESHVLKALTTTLCWPNFLAARVSKLFASLSVSSLCSAAIERARVRSAGEITSVRVASNN